MTKISERTVEDLSTLAMGRCEIVMKGILQLLDDPQHKMVLSTNVAAYMFGLAARFMQIDYKQREGEDVPFEKAVDAIVYHVAKLALTDPPPPVTLVFSPEPRSVMSAYRCPVCGVNDQYAYMQCSHPGCPDGRDISVREKADQQDAESRVSRPNQGGE